MKNLIRKRIFLGSVIEFSLPDFFVYGVVIEEDKSSGDTVLMFESKHPKRLENIGKLYLDSVRCKFRFVARHASMRKNSDILKIVGELNLSELPAVDDRFRLCLAGISDGAKWQIISGDDRVVVSQLTPETALLSDDGLPNMEYIYDYYKSDLHPWSAALTSKGAVDFNPVEFENKMRQDLASRQQNKLV